MLSSKIALNHEEFLLLREYIEKACGIVVGEDKVYLIESRLARLVVESGCSNFRDFYLRAKTDPTDKLKNKIIDAMTTNETLWFRDEKPWAILEEVIIPRFIDDLKKGRKRSIQIWSAAASTGQEAYSFAMILNEFLERDPGIIASQFNILATDISPSALYMAISGRYNTIAMTRGMRPAFRTKYFRDDNGVSEISEKIRKMVVFKQFNLLSDFARIPPCDLVFCRNVAIYFSSEVKTGLFRKIREKLDGSGYLLIGATESLMGYSNDFVQTEYKRGVYFQPGK